MYGTNTYFLKLKKHFTIHISLLDIQYTEYHCYKHINNCIVFPYERLKLPCLTAKSVMQLIMFYKICKFHIFVIFCTWNIVKGQTIIIQQELFVISGTDLCIQVPIHIVEVRPVMNYLFALDKKLHQLQCMGWNYLSIPKLQLLKFRNG